MGDILDIRRVEYKFGSNMDSVKDFVQFRDPNHQMDAHARKLLTHISADDDADRLSVDQESGIAARASLQQLGFRVGVPMRELAVLDKLRAIGARRTSLAFALDLWASRLGMELVGLVYTDPIPDENGTLYHLVVREVQRIRWLYAQRLETQRVWPPELKVVFSL